MRGVRSRRAGLLAAQGGGREGGDSGARPRPPVLARGRARPREPARRRVHFYPSAAKNSRRARSRARNSGPQIRQDDSALPGSGRGGSGGRRMVPGSAGPRRAVPAGTRPPPWPPRCPQPVPSLASPPPPLPPSHCPSPVPVHPQLPLHPSSLTAGPPLPFPLPIFSPSPALRPCPRRVFIPSPQPARPGALALFSLSHSTDLLPF